MAIDITNSSLDKLSIMELGDIAWIQRVRAWASGLPDRHSQEPLADGPDGAEVTPE